jgi:RNA ligase
MALAKVHGIRFESFNDMKDPILYKKMLKEVDAGNVTVSRLNDLRLFKYSMDCHIESRWNEVNRLARGLIMKEDGEIIARPFPKFFNMGERSETEFNNLPWKESFEITEKVDGSCGIGYIWDDQWHLATPGSFGSDQAFAGTFLLHYIYGKKLDALPKDCTPVFEIIYPENRIVVDYHGEKGLILLAIFEKNGTEWHSNRVDQIAEACGFRRPKRYNFALNDIPFEENFEGYVVRFESGLRVKIKSPNYVRVHRLLNYMSPKGVIDLIRGHEYKVTLESLPKNIAKDFDDIRSNVQNMYNDIKVRIENIMRDVPNGPRKEQALHIIKNTSFEERGLVFALLDNKDIEDSIWRLVQCKL